ncbi:hypothetical protein SERLA73DRAFT_148785 [Serpula lacrymans var. lacrymans S7.3]|uniref:Uncharacterized protein n=1 Tax=Serpula lacrymans var. lacrymans (strain S7.3) TaxID=936435 RepID=F8PEU2_SERL3|nr:hypothetical protein SERLA73DRAFT_148785 [Serpula lacrymans var. lacrymans S7.3]
MALGLKCVPGDMSITVILGYMIQGLKYVPGDVAQIYMDQVIKCTLSGRRQTPLLCRGQLLYVAGNWGCKVEVYPWQLRQIPLLDLKRPVRRRPGKKMRGSGNVHGRFFPPAWVRKAGRRNQGGTERWECEVKGSVGEMERDVWGSINSLPGMNGKGAGGWQWQPGHGIQNLPGRRGDGLPYPGNPSPQGGLLDS